MATSPSTDNYTLGKGIVFFDQKDNTSGLYTGERDLGNAPSFTFNVAIEKLEHYSSRGGLRAKDKEVISQITPGVSFTLDEINKENLSLLTLGSLNEVTQVLGVADAVNATAYLGNRTALDYRSVGSYLITTGTVTSGPFVAGETVTGGTSSATGTVVKVQSTVGDEQLWVVLTSIGTPFEDAEVITGGTSSASATADAAPVWAAGVILVQDSTDTTTYSDVTDYTVDTTLKDDVIGRFLSLSTGTITASETLHVSYNYAAATYTEVQAFAETQIEGRLRFVSDNPAGDNQELEIWRVSLTPSGDTALIGDDWSTLGFTGEVLKDETGHPSSPYMNITFTA